MNLKPKTLEQLDFELGFAREQFLLSIKNNEPKDITQKWKDAYQLACDSYYPRLYQRTINLRKLREAGL